MHKQKWQTWDRENYIYATVTDTGCIIGHRIDYNGVEVEITNKNVFK